MAISLFSLAIFSLVLNPIFCLDPDWQSANATWHPSIRVGRIENACGYGFEVTKAPFSSMVLDASSSYSNQAKHVEYHMLCLI
uniref:Uncharacterized protein n=1 Tax=Fagus sylvatica TaxID=28930 RepID=A0A2N9GNJ9_FAGSY